MKWSEDADSAIKKIPFFVRKKVKKKVEDFAEQKGKTIVELSDVNELKQSFLSKGGMEKEIKKRMEWWYNLKKSIRQKPKSSPVAKTNSNRKTNREAQARQNGLERRGDLGFRI